MCFIYPDVQSLHANTSHDGGLEASGCYLLNHTDFPPTERLCEPDAKK